MRVALVGLGDAGYTLHLPALAGLAGVETVGAADVSAERRQRAAARFGIPVFDDFDAMLRAAHPTVVIVGTPPGSHAELCLRALAAGAHVVCEKPFASSLGEADRILAAAQAAGRQVALNHEFREMPIFRAVRDAARGASGGPVFAQVWQQMDRAPWSEPGWRGQLRHRTLFEAGAHLVDFLMAVFGERPVAVQACSSSGGAHDSSTDAVAVVTLEFSRGRLAQITQTRLCKGPMQYFEARVETGAASLRASFGGRARVVAGLFRSTRPTVRIEYGAAGIAWRERGHHREFLARNGPDPGMQATRDVLERTFAAFHSGGTPPPTPPTSGETGRDVLAVTCAAYRSAEQGRRCVLDDALLRDLRDVTLG